MATRTKTAREIYLEAHGDAELLSHWYVRACQGMAERDENLASVRAERDEARRTLAAVCRVIQLPPEVARHIALYPPVLSGEQMKWALGVAERLAASQKDATDGE